LFSQPEVPHKIVVKPLHYGSKVCHDGNYMEVRNADNKRVVLAELLEQGMVLVTLDARTEGVDVPPHLRDDAQLRLNLSYRFGLPMILDEGGIRATLTFAGSPYPCCLPWRAVYLFVSHVTGRPILFPDDVPTEFSLATLAPAQQDATPMQWPSRGSGKPRLRVICSGGSAEESRVESATTGDDDKPPPRRGHLRVIK
jgi:stringent starvation protein B